MHIQKVALVYEPDVDSLPNEFRCALTEQDIQAIKTGPEFFADLADGKSPTWLRKVLKGCAEGGFDLMFYSSGGAPWRPYFRFRWQGDPAISLPRSHPLRTDMPAFLQQIYGVIGSFRENGFTEAGGLHAGDELGSVDEMGIWVEPGGLINPKSAVAFLETYSGSQLCYLPDGKGAWLEACKFRPVRSLEKEVARYFKALLEGTRI